MKRTDAEKNLASIIPTAITYNDAAIGKHRIHYIKAGSGPAILLIHGINMGWGQWYPNIAPLAKHGTVYAIDLPGAGGSSRLHPYDAGFPMDIAVTVEEFIRAKGLDNVTLVGHSIGGWGALMVALRGKVSVGKLVLLSPLGFGEKTPSRYRPLGLRPVANLLSKTAMRLTRANMKKFVVDVLHKPETLRGEFVDYYYDLLKKGGHAHPFLCINRFSGVFRIRKEFILLDKLAQIKQPTLIITGENDLIVPPDRHYHAALQLMPRAASLILSESGHVASTEESEKFNDAVIQFLKA